MCQLASSGAVERGLANEEVPTKFPALAATEMPITLHVAESRRSNPPHLRACTPSFHRRNDGVSRQRCRSYESSYRRVVKRRRAAWFTPGN